MHVELHYNKLIVFFFITFRETVGFALISNCCENYTRSSVENIVIVTCFYYTFSCHNGKWFFNALIIALIGF